MRSGGGGLTESPPLWAAETSLAPRASLGHNLGRVAGARPARDLPSHRLGRGVDAGVPARRSSDRVGQHGRPDPSAHARELRAGGSGHVAVVPGAFGDARLAIGRPTTVRSCKDESPHGLRDSSQQARTRARYPQCKRFPAGVGARGLVKRFPGSLPRPAGGGGGCNENEGAHKALTRMPEEGPPRISARLRNAQSSPPPEPSQKTTLADDLSRLAALRSSGALTDAEFEAAKAKLLGN